METEVQLETERFRLNRRGRPARNLTGLKFGALKVLGALQQVGGRTWLCACVCGNRIEVSGLALRRGKRSCGCARYKGDGVVTRRLAIWKSPPATALGDLIHRTTVEYLPPGETARIAVHRPWWRRLLDALSAAP